MIKSTHKNKFFIEHYILNEFNNFQDFYNSNCYKLLDNDIIGYHFSTKEPNSLRETQVLNVYLIKPEYYDKDCITIKELENAWKLFFNNPHKMIFRNPPIKEWIDTKENWCKKLATEITYKFGKPFDEALSDVYYTVTKLYQKPSVYMGNLNYVKNSVLNNIKQDIRSNNKKINQDSGLAVSLETPLSYNEDDEEITLSDMVAVDESYYEDNIEYLETLNNAKKLLRKTFSDREIDQIISQKPMFLPKTLYKKLCDWRYKHSPEDIYE